MALIRESPAIKDLKETNKNRETPANQALQQRCLELNSKTDNLYQSLI